MIPKQNSKPRQVVVVQMRNDLSGSTRVLSQVLAALKTQDVKIDLYTSTIDYQGFLSHIPEINTRAIPYNRYSRRFSTFASYLYSQVWLFFSLFKYINKPVTVYINTVLPFGAALSAWLLRKKVVYHVHEISLAPAPKLLRKWFFFILKLTASKIIFVSNFLKEQLPLLKEKNTVIYNSLPKEFFELASSHQKPSDSAFSVLMVSSLADYKGVPEFVALSRQMPQLKFELVLNASESEVAFVFDSKKIPSNLKIHSAQENVHPFYRRANVILNLSDPQKHIETFGMTILEGMAYGLPALVPTVGGVLELVEDGINGYHVEGQNLDLVSKRILSLKNNPEKYGKMSTAALAKVREFKPQAFTKDIIAAVLN